MQFTNANDPLPPKSAEADPDDGKTRKTLKKTVHYRRCQFHPSPTQTLQQLVEAAMSQQPLTGDRAEATDPAATSFRMIGHCSRIGAMTCGTVLVFERGRYQMVVNDDPAAKSIILEAMQPPRQGEVQQQFVPGVLFFAIFENHVAVVQSATLRTTGFEQHLAWLLRSKCGLLDKQHGLVLADEPNKRTKDLLRGSRVKALSVGKPFMVAAEPAGPDGAQDPASDKTAVLKPDAGVLSALKSFLPGDGFSGLDLDDAVFDGDLEVWLEIRYPAYARSKPESTAKLMDNLAIALRDQEEESVELELEDGTRVKGKDLKISGSLGLTLLDGAPDVGAFHSDMVQWLTTQLHTGMVSS